MKVVMLKDVKGVGQRGKVVEVSDGFALNSLIPQGKAVHATAEKLAQVQKQMENASFEKAKHDAELATKIRALEGKSVIMVEKASDKGHLFKGVKKADIVAKLAVPEEVVSGLDETIRSTGEYKLHLAGSGAKATVMLTIKAA